MRVLARIVAAFLPQIFGRVAQTSVELTTDELTSITLVFGAVSWQVFRSGRFYLAVLGKAGESLPSGKLSTLAAELSRQNK